MRLNFSHMTIPVQQDCPERASIWGTTGSSLLPPSEPWRWKCRGWVSASSRRRGAWSADDEARDKWDIDPPLGEDSARSREVERVTTPRHRRRSFSPSLGRRISLRRSFPVRLCRRSLRLRDSGNFEFSRKWQLSENFRTAVSTA